MWSKDKGYWTYSASSSPTVEINVDSVGGPVGEKKPKQRKPRKKKAPEE